MGLRGRIMLSFTDMEIAKKAALFETENGTEGFLAVEADAGLDIHTAVATMFGDYAELLRRHSLDEDSEVFVRFHLSDIANQAGFLRAFLNDRHADTFYSLIGQPPASGSKIAMTAYHIKGANPFGKTKQPGEGLAVDHNGYTSLWTKSLPRMPGRPEEQTREIFDGLSQTVGALGGDLRNNVIRTWIYIRDIDMNYRAFADSRGSFFAGAGMDENGHTIASTGIEGSSENLQAYVAMESLAVFGLEPGQIRYMSAPEHMCSTHRYNVTFERGTKVAYGDRTHYFISGTASIDKEGEVVHPCDVERQALRCLENISALLSEQGAGLPDLKALNVYVRDFSDAGRLSALLRETLPGGIPYVIVLGAICRPSWLIEIDGLAVTAEHDEEFRAYC
jgi:enamine deaminase RidA (YjgF/YER057c/UK114 family)